MLGLENSGGRLETLLGLGEGMVDEREGSQCDGDGTQVGGSLCRLGPYDDTRPFTKQASSKWFLHEPRREAARMPNRAGPDSAAKRSVCVAPRLDRTDPSRAVSRRGRNKRTESGPKNSRAPNRH